MVISSSPASSVPSPDSAAATASLMASEVTVAPVTASTSVLCASTIACGICSIAGSLIPAVSLCSSTSTSEILPSSTVTATFTAPPMPFAEPSYTPFAGIASAIAYSGVAIASAMVSNTLIPFLFMSFPPYILAFGKFMRTAQLLKKRVPLQSICFITIYRLFVCFAAAYRENFSKRFPISALYSILFEKKFT